MSWELVQVTHSLGDRRDFFLAQQDPWEVIRVIIEGRKRREIDPTVAVLRECVAQFKTESETPAIVRERLIGQLEFLETVTSWYDSIKTLPRKTLLKMMRLGHRIAKVIGE
jgi:DNA-binding transcriptional regulator GbsR (MarR family)